MHIEDIHRIYCDRMTKVASVNADPGHLQVILEQTKNDIMGTGPSSGRTYKLPCLCSSQEFSWNNLRLLESCRTNPSV